MHRAAKRYTAWRAALVASFVVAATVLLQPFLSRTEATPGVVPEPLTIVGSGVAYQPRGYFPGRENDPEFETQITADLRLLKETGFRSLVTYGAEGALARIPELARREGFDGTIIMGVWDPNSRQELERAVAAREHVDGYAIGNEGLGLRYEMGDLSSALDYVRTATGRPVTTTEPIDSYLVGPYREWLLAESDWLFPLAHPYWAVHFEPLAGVQWLIARHDYLAAMTGRSVVLKEAGFPTHCDETCSEAQQAAVFAALEKAAIAFFYFEAFDQPWKVNGLKFGVAEAHWGLFDAVGNPKPVVARLQDRDR